MAVYLVAQITVRDPQRYADYRQMVPPTLAVYGGRFLVRGGAVENLEGSWEPSRFVVIEFPDRDRARAWWSSDEYAPAKALRQQSADTEMILVEGV
jgi:uncharacterized protein (DUF1330 family)